MAGPARLDQPIGIFRKRENMKEQNFAERQAELEKEISFRMSRASGKGGQHVNKVSTRVELLFDVLKLFEYIF